MPRVAVPTADELKQWFVRLDWEKTNTQRLELVLMFPFRMVEGYVHLARGAVADKSPTRSG